MSVRDKHTEYSPNGFSPFMLDVRFWYPQSKYLRSYSIIYTLTHSTYHSHLSTIQHPQNARSYSSSGLLVLTFTTSRYFRLNVNFLFIIDLRKAGFGQNLQVTTTTTSLSTKVEKQTSTSTS